MKIQVIIKVPDCDIDDGNLYDENFVAYQKEKGGKIVFRPYNNVEEYRFSTNIPVQLEAFQEGELLIVDEDGREVSGKRRKANQWFVEYKEFDIKDLDKAIKLAIKLEEEKK